MLKRTTKRTTVILLALVMSFGLFVVGYGSESQDIGAKISGSTDLTVPNGISGWSLNYTVGNGTTQDNTMSEDSSTENSSSSADTDTAIVEANCPYQLKVKVSSTSHPDSPVDAHMSNSTTSEDLTIPLKLAYENDRGDVTSYDLNSMDFNDNASPSNPTTAITTSNQVLFDTPVVPDDGIDYIGFAPNQELVLTDPAYTSGGSQVTYEIKLTWSVSAVTS